MKAAWMALLAASVYATVRYHLFADVPWSDWPMYTMNKAVAVAALLVLAIHVVGSRLKPGRHGTGMLSAAASFAAVHMVLSVMLLSPAYYEGFYRDGKFTAEAGLSMALGVAVAAIGAKRRASQGTHGRNRNLAVIALMVGLHALLMGYRKWLAPDGWPGLMPPLTLVSFVVGISAFAIGAYPKRRN